MSDFLVIYTKIVDDGGSHFYQAVLIRKVLEATRMEHYNGLPIPIKVEAPLGTDENGYEANIDWPNSHASVIGMTFYLASNTRPYIYFAFNQCVLVYIYHQVIT